MTLSEHRTLSEDEGERGRKREEWWKWRRVEFVEVRGGVNER